MYKLPKKVLFCKKCVYSNIKPTSVPEWTHDPDRTGAKYLKIESDGICTACKNITKKNKIDWEEREKNLLKLLDKHRNKHGEYDCIVPGSGGKDSVLASHILKHKYGMNPLTVTWQPVLYTDYGYKNYINWIDNAGLDNYSVRPGGKVSKAVTREAILNLFHPFQTFILGQKNLAPKIAAKLKIPLIFYGESEIEYGNPLAENNKSLRSKIYYVRNNKDKILLGGKKLNYYKEKYNLDPREFEIYLPMNDKDCDQNKIEVHYLGYYLQWVPQEAFYYSVENSQFLARPFRTAGTYSKYNGIDDKMDDLHFYTTFIKFGIGRATYDAAQEIRNKHLTREDAKLLVKKYDGEFPKRYFSDIIKFLDIKEEVFFKIEKSFRHPRIWKKVGNKYYLRHTVNKDGTDD